MSSKTNGSTLPAAIESFSIMTIDPDELREPGAEVTAACWTPGEAETSS